MKLLLHIFKSHFHTLFLFLLLIFLVLFSFRPIEMGDNWWHLKTGQWIIQQGAVPHEDVFSFNRERDPWVLTQWMGSSIFYMAYNIGGYVGLKIFRTLIVIAILGIFYISTKKRFPLSLSILLVYLMAHGLEYRCHLRPFIFNFIFLQLFLICLLAYQKESDRKRLLVLPLLGILWFNINIGSFVYGILLISIFLFTEAINYFIAVKKRRVKKTTSLIRQRLRDYLLVLVMYILSFIVNPYGIEGFTYPFQVFLKPGFMNFYQYNNLIGEMLPPTYIYTSLSGLWFYVLLIFGILALIYGRKNKLTRLTLFVVSLAMFLLNRRGGPFFTIVTVYILAESALDISLKRKWNSSRFFKKLDKVVIVLVIFILISQSIKIFNQKVYSHNRFEKTLALDFVPNNPASAIEFLRKYDITGPVFNMDNFGGYLIWNAYPDLRPFIDGRQFKQKQHLLEYLSILSHPGYFWPNAESKYHFRIALLDSAKKVSPRLIGFLSDNPNWQLIFVEGSILVFVKKGMFQLPAEILQMEREYESLKASPQDLERLKLVLAQPSHNKWLRLMKPPLSHVDIFAEGKALMYLGYKDAAMERFIKTLDVDVQRVRDHIRYEDRSMRKPL